MIDISEKNFEATIEQSLLTNGHRKRDAKDYERSLCLIPSDVLDLIYATQQEE